MVHWCFDSFGEIDFSRPSRIKTGVHSIDSSVPGVTSVEAKVTLHYDERRGRIVQDRTFDGTQWIEFVSPFDEALGFRKKSDVHKLGNEVRLGLTGYSFRAFHQDIKPPQSAVCTVSGGRKLWLFRAPESRDAERVGRVASSLTLSDVQQLMKDKRKGPRFLLAIQEDGESISTVWLVTLCTDCSICILLADNIGAAGGRRGAPAPLQGAESPLGGG